MVMMLTVLVSFSLLLISAIFADLREVRVLCLIPCDQFAIIDIKRIILIAVGVLVFGFDGVLPICRLSKR